MSQEKKFLLVIEDDPGLQKQLRWSFDAYEVLVAGDREGALALARRHEPAVVTMDLGYRPTRMAPRKGWRLLEQILDLAPDTKVIVLTGNQDHAHAVKAIGMGAYDFHQKPCDPECWGWWSRARSTCMSLQQENRRICKPRRTHPIGGILRGMPALAKVCRNIEKVAPSDATVMLLGESGTGKEILARTLHQSAPEKKNALWRSTVPPFRKRFWKANCSAMKKGRLRARPSRRRARSSLPMKALSFSMRSAIYPCRCRPSFCVSCRNESLKESAGVRKFPSTCASSAPRIRI